MTPTCEEVIALLSDHLEASLGPKDAVDLQGHLHDCPECVAYLNTYRKTRDLTAKVAAGELPEKMKARLRRYLMELLAKMKP